jgi:hypothetical protein
MIEARITPMQPQANCCPGPAAAKLGWSGETSPVELLALLAGHDQKALVFAYGGREVLPGYHVTEVKSATFASLDCGASRESWRETVIQLWDVPGEPGRGHMGVGKFLAIVGKVAEQVDLAADTRLTFEVSDGTQALQLFALAGIETDDETVRVTLRARPASCKPRDRWLEQHASAPRKSALAGIANACCG